MSEVFKEYLVKRKKSSKDVLLQVGLCVGAVIVSVILFAVGGAFIGPIGVCAVVFGTYYLFSRFNREYEYILTNNELDIDVIYNRNSRKRVITIDMKKIDKMHSIQDKEHHQVLGKDCKIYNLSDNTYGPDTYKIIGQNDESGKYCILITPNDSILQDMYRQAPSKVFKSKY